MSRYTLNDSRVFGAVVFGWDEGVNGFYLQCFEVDDDDDEPTVWRPRLSLIDLQLELAEHGISLPELVRRVLHAEERAQRVAFEVEDPVLFRDRNTQRMFAGRVVEMRPAIFGASSRALIEYANGVCWQDAAELEPDLQSVGVF
jgi:hypothetical protein